MVGESKLPKARRRKPAQSDERGLSKDAVLNAALEIIDAKGLDAFSMRALAQRLKVYPTAIYWYVPNKNALLAEVVRVALRDTVPKSPPADWEPFLTKLFHGYRDAVRKHPNIAPLIGAQLVSNWGADFKLVDSVLEALSAAGFRGEQLLAAYDVLIAAMVGFVTMEFANLPAGREDAGNGQRDRQDCLPASSRAQGQARQSPFHSAVGERSHRSSRQKFQNLCRCDNQWPQTIAAAVTGMVAASIE
jgi:AcrR family transcriptional regulator